MSSTIANFQINYIDINAKLYYYGCYTQKTKIITLFHYLALACEASCHHVVFIDAFSVQCLLETIVCDGDLKHAGIMGTRRTHVVLGVGIAQGLAHEGVFVKLVPVGWP